MRKKPFPLYTYFASMGLSFLIFGCSQENKNPFLTSPPTGVTSASMEIRASDPSSPPDIKVIMQVSSNLGTNLTDFKLGNFSILQDGKPVLPNAVGLESDPPFSAALVIDRSGSMQGSRTTAANTGATSFVNALGANDRAAVIDFASGVSVAAGFTTNKTVLADTINAGVASGGTAFFDGVIRGVEELSKESGLKLLIALGDGDDNANSNDLASTITKVQGTGVVIHTIALGTGITDTSAYQQIAIAGGGQLHTSVDGSDLSSIYVSILNDPSFQNLIFVKFRRRLSAGDITVYLNYGSITTSAVLKSVN